jgi:putative ABC transport system permease protein
MLRNYLKIACRKLLHNKTYGFTNIAGLTIGLAAFWMIALYVADELSYDRFPAKAGRIYRLTHFARWDGGSLKLAPTSAPFAPAMKPLFPEMEEIVRIVPEGGGIISGGNKKIKAEDIFFADKNVYRVFDYPFVEGDPQTALSKPRSIVLTESLAVTLFGSAAKALNQTISFEDKQPVAVTGVMKDAPSNSHLHFSALRSLPDNYTSGWQNFDTYTYVLLAKGVDPAKLQPRLAQFARNTIQKEMGVPEYRMELQPLTAIHLHSSLDYEISANSSTSRVYTFMAIAVLILVIAFINYINLSTAQASGRVREVGVRKAIGSGWKQLAGMFLTESVLVTLIASFLSILLVSLLLPFFNTLAGKQLSLWQLGKQYTLLVMLGFSLFTGLLSGLYPAFFITRFHTIPALKGQTGSLAGSVLLRRSLVVFQFVITIVMVSGSCVIYRQLQYTSRIDLGFNKEQVVSFHIDNVAVRRQAAALKAQLLQSPLIEGAAVAGNPIGNNDLGQQGFYIETDKGFTNGTRMAVELMADADFLQTMGIQLLRGRNFSAGNSSDKYGAVLVNEAMVKEMGWKTNPVGKKIQFAPNPQQPQEERTIIGVVKDFHTHSLQYKVEPLVMLMPPQPLAEDNLYVKLKQGETSAALAYLEKVYRQFDKDNPLEIHFLDQNFARQYEAERKQGRLSLIFTVLSILISGFGLFGLAAFMAVQRRKEIGIRKVLGASVLNITGMLGKDFARLILIALVIAVPVAWFAMHQWLQHFVYRIAVPWWVFLFAGCIAFLTAFLTIGFRAVKAALANPVDSLRTE